MDFQPLSSREKALVALAMSSRQKTQHWQKSSSFRGRRQCWHVDRLLLLKRPVVGQPRCSWECGRVGKSGDPERTRLSRRVID